MHTHSRIVQMSALALGIAGALAFGQAQASGFQLKENSAKALGRAFAGSGVAAPLPTGTEPCLHRGHTFWQTGEAPAEPLSGKTPPPARRAATRGTGRRAGRAPA